MKTIAVFNPTSGVGKTALTYHLAWMCSNLGVKTLAVDLDPQINLTALFLDEDRLLDLLSDTTGTQTVYESIQPILDDLNIVDKPHVEIISDTLGLLPGNPSLIQYEDQLSEAWLSSLINNKYYNKTFVFNKIISLAADKKYELVFIDIGSNLGSISRSALLTVDQIYIPLRPDILSLLGMTNLGIALHTWHSHLLSINKNISSTQKPIMQPFGYIIQAPYTYLSRPIKMHQSWIERIPFYYSQSILDKNILFSTSAHNDNNCVAILKYYSSLMAMTSETHKPMFSLKPADGAIGAHVKAVQDCYNEFKQLAQKIADSSGVLMA